MDPLSSTKRQNNTPHSSSPHSEMFDAAYTGNLNRFKRLALNHAKGEEIGVREEIRKAKDRDGRGSLHIAAAGGSLQVCRYLLETLKLDVDPKDGRGITPLYHAIFEGHLDTVRYLLENGAYADASSDANYTPLRCAAESGDIKIITLLLSRGARVDVASRSGTALQEAAFNGHRDAVKVLLDHGANPNVAIGLYTYIPLFSAISAKSWECVELLLQAGADPNAVSYGYTPLAIPAKYGHVDVIRRLLKAGADPNYKMN
ncbi:hypothetical protein MKW94_027747, partial [Papaver nudicaule]|nr:hypothetical protein [Papaver nudicaule]